MTAPFATSEHPAVIRAVPGQLRGRGQPLFWGRRYTSDDRQRSDASASPWGAGRGRGGGHRSAAPLCGGAPGAAWAPGGVAGGAARVGCLSGMSATVTWSRRSTSAIRPTRSLRTRRWASCARPGRRAPSGSASYADATQPADAAALRPATAAIRAAGRAGPAAAVVLLAEQAVVDGFRRIRLKVGTDLDEDVRRLRPARKAAGAQGGRAQGGRPRTSDRRGRQPVRGRRRRAASAGGPRAMRPALDRGTDEPRRRPGGNRPCVPDRLCASPPGSTPPTALRRRAREAHRHGRHPARTPRWRGRRPLSAP